MGPDRGATADRPRTIQAAFGKRSYAPGERAGLLFRGPRRRVVVQLFRAGPERLRPQRDDVLLGVAAAPPVPVRGRGLGRTRTLSVAIGKWPSGLYFARPGAAGGWLGFAPVVIRRNALGRTRVAVPTNTWQAYNFRDVDRDGVGDTWYANPRIASVDLRRPYLDRGVPPHFRGYDRGFHRWLVQTQRSPDYVADDDLERFSGARLAALYDLIVFGGHEEYVTQQVYDAIVRFRDLGGNPTFLSANNFFYRVERGGAIASSGRVAGATSDDPRPRSSDPATWAGSRTAIRTGRTSSWEPSPHRGCSVGLAFGTGITLARTGSRSTRGRRTRPVARVWLRESPTCSAAADPRR